MNQYKIPRLSLIDICRQRVLYGFGALRIDLLWDRGTENLIMTTVSKIRHQLKRLPAAVFLTIALCCFRHSSSAQSRLFVDKEIRYCENQASRTLKTIPVTEQNLPRSIGSNSRDWKFVNSLDWCSGFWPGILWYLYETTHQSVWEKQADKFTRELAAVAYHGGFDHDLGFVIYTSFGNGYRLTGNPLYKQEALSAADSLATLFNPKVGTILSWPSMVKKMGWPHNTIIDNMLNLELLFWASKNGGSQRLYDIAVKHAETTMKNHFRPDYSAYHVIVYDTATGEKIKGVTHQGYADNSMWARGQTWAIYGFTMCYRETHKREFLDFAQKVADVYLKRLPSDEIPFWDFDDPAIPNAPKDASASAVCASGLLELSGFVENKEKASYYKKMAVTMLHELSSAKYQSRDINNAFLMHATGHKPAGTEIDASIIYGDYYYLEALIRLKKIESHQSIYTKLQF